MILYFTGTGNSRYVADALGARLDDQVINVFDYIRNNKRGSFESEQPWVFVGPVYLSTVAQSFRDFIQQSSFKGNKKAYFVATCASNMGSAPNDCQILSSIKGFEYMGCARVQMPQNYITMFKMTPKDECERRYDAALLEADKIAKTILMEDHIEEKFAPFIEYKATKLVEMWYNKSFTKTKKFYATDACIGCGLCERNCPTKKISMVDGKPQWNGNCIHCMACINACPKQAIEYGKATKDKSRYMCKKYK